MSEIYKGTNEVPKLPTWRLNNMFIDFSKMDKSLLSYLDELPQDIQDKVKITSAIEGKHATNSRHYKGRAFDLSINKEDPYNDPVFMYMAKDQSRKGKNITMLDPMHGSAPHIHLSSGEGSENKLDYMTVDEHDSHSEDEREPNSFNYGLEDKMDSFVNEMEEIRQKLEVKDKEAKMSAEAEASMSVIEEKQSKREALKAMVNEFDLSFSQSEYK